jgi:hypothetical protein
MKYIMIFGENAADVAERDYYEDEFIKCMPKYLQLIRFLGRIEK